MLAPMECACKYGELLSPLADNSVVLVALLMQLSR
jgi:hypothetical protein